MPESSFICPSRCDSSAMGRSNENDSISPVTAAIPDWRSIYLTNRAAMYRAAHSVLGGGKEQSHQGLSASDIVQETMTQLIGTGVPEEANLEAFLITATVRRGIDAVRRMRSRPQALTEGSHRSKALLSGDDVEEAALRAVLTGQVLAHLHLLSDKQRYAFVQCVIEGRNRTVVAPEMNLSRARVGQLVAEAAERLLRAVSGPEELPRNPRGDEGNGPSA
jgi:RNA polymerase sigma factor (sigma-70 family)